MSRRKKKIEEENRTQVSTGAAFFSKRTITEEVVVHYSPTPY